MTCKLSKKPVLLLPDFPLHFKCLNFISQTELTQIHEKNVTQIT